MKNKEKYAKEIVEAVTSKFDNSLGFNRYTKKPTPCAQIRCEDCIFNYGNRCSDNIYEWANAEYEEPQRFTEREKEFIKMFPEIKYLCRLNMGAIAAYTEKPKITESGGIIWYYTDNPENMKLIDCWGLEFNSIKYGSTPTTRWEILGDDGNEK